MTDDLDIPEFLKVENRPAAAKITAPLPDALDGIPDPVATFRNWTARWVARYVGGRASLHRVVDVLEAMTPDELSADQAQAIIADAITLATEDEYQGLSPSFARACKLADGQKAARKQTQACDRRLKTCQDVARSMLDAAEYLISERSCAL
jgi:hypothetical protein